MDLVRNYARKALPDEVNVAYLAGAPGLISRDHEKLRRRLETSGQRFGYSTSAGRLSGSLGQGLPSAPSSTLSHMIVVTDKPFDHQIVAQLGSALSSWSSISVAFAYASEADMYRSEPDVEAAKHRHGARFNFLFPDLSDGPVRYVSEQKILDNAVCDTVRVKFTPHRIADRVELPTPIANYFRAASRAYDDEHLYLRAPTDGYIAARHGDGFFITATRTSKVDLDLQRVSFIHGYDRLSNELTFSGPFLPSSDAVEAAIVLDARPDIAFLLHTHASKLFTRNPVYRSRVVVPQLPYGEPELGDAIVSGLEQVGDGFIIMEEHGDIFAGSSDQAAFFAAVTARCREARRLHAPA